LRSLPLSEIAEKFKLLLPHIEANMQLFPDQIVRAMLE